jgi:hypothetical protein
MVATVSPQPPENRVSSDVTAVPDRRRRAFDPRSAAMARLMRNLALVFAFALSQPPLARAAEQVDLLLVLASDVSRSVDFAKFKLQRDGYAKAIADPNVIKAVTSGPHGRVAISFVEWAGPGQQKIVVDWTLIDGPAAAGQFADQVLKVPRSFSDRTSISGAIDFAVAQLERAPFQGARRTIDISGDGTNNAGAEVTATRDRALALGITINGLVILTESPQPWNAEHTNPPGGLEDYYRTNVIGGPGGFVLAAQDFSSFGEAIIKKLIAEVAMLPGPTMR